MNPEISATDRPVDALGRSEVLGTIADAIQPTVRYWLEGDDGARRPIKDFLHGTWLGHALHPLLTDIPIGAWTVTAACDVLELFGVERAADAGDISLIIGEMGAYAAAITGWAEWSDTKDEPQRVGMMHALLNGVGSSLFLASFVARRRGARKNVGIPLSLIGYGFIGAAAYLGGELSLGMQLGSKHTTVPIEPSGDFVHVAQESALSDDALTTVDAGGIPVLLSRRDGKVHAVSAVCTHRGAPLTDGTYADGCVKCPWHGSRFSVDDGAIVEGPATFPLARFDTQVADGGVAIRPHR